MLAVKAWAFTLFFEVIHQIIIIIKKILNREEEAHQLIEQMKETGGQQISTDATLQLRVVVFSIILGAVAIAFVGVIFALVNSFNKATKRAFLARRALAYYGLFLGLRIVIIFSETPANSLPIALFAIDGAIAITVGVIALVAVVLGARDDSLKWVGETPVGFSPPPTGQDEKKDSRKK
ncbi:MAG: hypothetical protein Q4A82_04630 [Corynebacterium sp.]|nr:hypothetical protein [Corynebacterium sp.]